MSLEDCVNRDVILEGTDKLERPCHKLGYCPYGELVEVYPHYNDPAPTRYSCLLFGHDCPMYYLAKGVTEKEGFWSEDDMV